MWRHFFKKKWEKQLFIDFFTRLAIFKRLWRVDSRAFSHQTFFCNSIGFQLIKIYWKTRAHCWHLVLAVPNVKIFFCKTLQFWQFSCNSFWEFSEIKNQIGNGGWKPYSEILLHWSESIICTDREEKVYMIHI